ncbi:MAG: impB/mucB/samB family protein [Micavibrio sp.]|nr:impB/mucB/samB family protein [Micavibrio sp.]
MPQEETVQYLFLDLNSYFASIEQQESPDLRGQPIAVVPMPTDNTCAIAASYEAKAYGIKTGTKIYDAKRLCPQLKCVLAKHHLYVEYHEKLLEEFVKHTPIRKVWSIDEWSSYLPLPKQPVSEAIKLAQRIKQGIWNNVGEAINCSIGLAPNGLLAKIASDIQKPDGLTVITKNNLQEKLFSIPLTSIPGIGYNMLHRLNKAGIWSMEDFWRTSPKQARKIWGSVQGERLWYQLHGFEIPDIETKKSMIGHSRILDPHLRSPVMAKHIAKRLTIKAAQRLRRSNHYAKHFVLSVRTTESLRWAQMMNCQPAHDTITFLDMLNKLWTKMLTELKPYKMKKLSVTMHGLSETSTANGDLFDHKDTHWQQVKQHREQLSNVIETLNKRYGIDTINFGIPPKTIAGYVGTKIAFSRVPDKAEFSE